MNDIIPEQGLGPQNQKWRQWVERKITNLQRNMEQKFGADVNNSLSAVNSSMSRIAKDLGYLSQLRTYSELSPAQVTSTTPTGGVFVPLKTLNLRFTLEEKSTVVISVRGEVLGRDQSTASGTGLASPAVFFLGEVYKEVAPAGPGALFDFTESAQVGVSVSAGVQVVASLDSNLSAQRTVILDAGYHDLSLKISHSGLGPTGYYARVSEVEFSASVINLVRQT